LGWDETCSASLFNMLFPLLLVKGAPDLLKAVRRRFAVF